MNKTERTLELLRTRWLTSLDCALQGGCLSLSQRVSNARADGLVVSDRWVETQGGALVKAYRIFAHRQKRPALDRPRQ